LSNDNKRQNGKPTRSIGILTAGGDCPGLNAAIRAVAKSAMHYDIQVVGFLDGFRGLVENRYVQLEDRAVSGIITLGGTILGSSRDKPHKMDMGGTIMDMTDVAVANADRLNLDCLVCLGGNGTQKNAYRLSQKGLNIITLPKTIDNDVVLTDTCFGYDTAKSIATGRSTVSTPPPAATTVSSRSRSWGTPPAGWRSAPASQAVPMSS